MTNGLLVTLFAFIYSLALNIHYFRKKHIVSYETKIFGFLLISNLIGIILEIACNLIIFYGNNEGILCLILNKALLTYLNIFISAFSVYTLVITHKNIIKNMYDFFNTIKLSFIIFAAITEIFIVMLPLFIFKDNFSVYSYGPAPSMMYVISAVCMLICIYSLLRNIKSLKNKEFIPIVGFIILGLVCALIQKINPALTLIISAETFILFLMFFTIENPDVKMIEELNMERDRADKANNAKTEFLSNMSHEIRTPLNAIVGFSNSLIDDADDKEKIKDDAKYIVNASQNLLELVNGILDISKIEAGKIEIVNTEYDMIDALDNLVALSKARLGEKPIEFRTSFDESIPKYLYGDISRIKQICINLLTNSIKYTKEGFIEFKVSSVIKDDICRLIISVEDSGIGIKNEDIDKLFEKFGRLDLEKNISIEGSGLGLAITKKLIEMMGGKIVVQSEYGIGSKFTISIDQKISKGTSKINSPKEQTNYQSKYPGKKILVIDDNKLNLKVAEKVLEPFKVTIQTASSGDEGIEKIINETFDLVLLDDMMPGKTGTDTLKELKENLADYQTPTVALTANAVVGMKEKYLAAGFDDYLAKPIEKEELKRILNKYLKN